jgi:hypothetical protein
MLVLHYYCRQPAWTLYHAVEYPAAFAEPALVCAAASADKPGQQELVSNQVAGVALLSKSGREVLLGQLRGTITVYDTASQQVLDVVKVRGKQVKVWLHCSLRRKCVTNSTICLTARWW